MTYNKELLKKSFEEMRTKPAQAAVFYAEADKCFRALLPTSKQTSELYRAAEPLFGGYYNIDDLVQDCLIVLFQKIDEGCVSDTKSLDGDLAKIAENRLGNFYEKESNRNSIATFKALDESCEAEYHESYDLDEEELSAISQNIEKPIPKNKSNKVYQVSKNFKFIAEFNTIEEAAAATGINPANISKCCNHKRKSAGKYIWLNSNDNLTKLITFAA